MEPNRLSTLKIRGYSIKTAALSETTAELRRLDDSERVGMLKVSGAVSVGLAMSQTIFLSRGLRFRAMLPYAKFRV